MHLSWLNRFSGEKLVSPRSLVPCLRLLAVPPTRIFSHAHVSLVVSGLKGELAVEEAEEEERNQAREARRKERRDKANNERQLRRDEARSAMAEEGETRYFFVQQQRQHATNLRRVAADTVADSDPLSVRFPSQQLLSSNQCQTPYSQVPWKRSSSIFIANIVLDLSTMPGGAFVKTHVGSLNNSSSSGGRAGERRAPRCSSLASCQFFAQGSVVVVLVTHLLPSHVSLSATHHFCTAADDGPASLFPSEQYSYMINTQEEVELKDLQDYVALVSLMGERMRRWELTRQVMRHDFTRYV